jgi:hypothetical protein
MAISSIVTNPVSSGNWTEKENIMTAQKDNPYLTITLTDRRPVKIRKEEWPIIAEAEDFRHDGQVECQAGRKWMSNMKVRQHEDGRTIVYAVADYDTIVQNESCFGARGGEMLTVEIGNTQPIVDAIKRVGQRMISRLPEAYYGERESWDQVINGCIADLPAEEL